MSENTDTSNHTVDANVSNPETRPDFDSVAEKRDLLKTSIEYMQERLNFVNDKANIFIAIQTGLFIGIVWLLGTFFLPSVEKGVTIETIFILCFLLVNFAFIVAIVALLLQTIRPSETYLSLFTSVDTIKTTGIIWPKSNIPEPSDFVDCVDSMSTEDINLELIGTVYVLQQLVDQTYTSYRRAVLLMKIQIFVIPVGFLAIALQTYV